MNQFFLKAEYRGLDKKATIKCIFCGEGSHFEKKEAELSEIQDWANQFKESHSAKNCNCITLEPPEWAEP